MAEKPKLPRDKSFLSKKKYDRVNQTFLNKSLSEGKNYGFVSKTNTLKSPTGLPIKKGSAINTNIKKQTVSSPGLFKADVSFGQPTVERKSFVRFKPGDLQGTSPSFRTTTAELGKSLNERKPKTDARISAQTEMSNKSAGGLSSGDVQKVKSGYDAPLKSGGTKKEYFGTTEKEFQTSVKPNVKVSFLKTSTPKTEITKSVSVTPPQSVAGFKRSTGSGTAKPNPVSWIKNAQNKKSLSKKGVPMRIRYK